MLNGDQSLDLALFGRMVADNPELNVDASAQVAHALSTHEIVPEYDYFTALDDLQPEDNAGAAMLGSLEFNSSTLYRYANININELAYNLDQDSAITGAVSFVKEFLLTMPTGKQNTFANKTLPSYVMVNLRTDTPVNLVSAFEEPVKSKDGYVKKSIQKFEKEFETSQDFVDTPKLSVVLSKFDTNDGDKVANVTELLQSVTDGLKKRRCRMKTLTINFNSPLQSYGNEASFSRRTSSDYPSKSAVIGMLAAAMGYRRDDNRITALNDLKFAVRVDQPGRTLTDYQTVEWKKKEPEKSLIETIYRMPSLSQLWAVMIHN